MMFKITLPADGSGDGLKLELDGEDITDKISVRKIAVDLEARKSLVATMDVYVDEVEAACLAENMTVNVDHSHCKPGTCSEKLLPPLDLAESYDEILAAWPEGHRLPDVLRKYVHQQISETADRTFADLQRKFGTAVGGNLQVSNPVHEPAAPQAYLPERMKGDEPKDADQALWHILPPIHGQELTDIEINGVPVEELECENPPPIAEGDIIHHVIMGADFASAVDTTVRAQVVKDDDGGNRFHPLMTAGED